jgi:hypothetical protein
LPRHFLSRRAKNEQFCSNHTHIFLQLDNQKIKTLRIFLGKSSSQGLEMDVIDNSQLFDNASTTTKFLQEKLPELLAKPEIGIICGSGLGGLSDAVHNEHRVEVNYADIPHFPRSTGQEFSGY